MKEPAQNTGHVPDNHRNADVPESFRWKELLRKEAWKQYFREWFLESTQSNLRLSLTVALGVFIGILPIFGLQSITALSLAWVFRFNKLITLAGSGKKRVISS